jgi:hypothetical protein
MELFKSIRSAFVRGTPLGKGAPLSRRQVALLAGLVIFATLVITIFLTRQSHFSAPAYLPGDIARTDILIPMDALIEDEEATQARRDEAKGRALPVYRFNPSLQADQAAKLKRVFSQSRALLGLDAAGKRLSGGSRGRPFRSLPVSVQAQLRSSIQYLGMKPPVDDLLVFLVREGFTSSQEDQLLRLLRDLFPALLASDGAHFSKGNIHKMNIVTGKVETVPVGLLATSDQVQKKIVQQIGQSPLPVAGRSSLRRLLESLIIPNLTYDESLTKARQEEDVKNIDHVLRKLKKGKVVLRQGDEVESDHLVQIEAIRKLTPPGSSWSQTLGSALLIGILLTIFIFFAPRIASGQWRPFKLAGFLILVLTLNLLLLKASWFVCESVSQSFLTSPFNDKTYFFYLLPFACGSMLVSLLAGERCAHIFIIFFCILAGQVAGMEAYGLFYILIVNLAGILFMRKAQQRIRLIGAGFKLGLVSAVLYILIQAAAGASLDPLGTGFGAGLAFLSGPFNAFFLVFTLPLCERVFMVTTEIRLSELGNMSLPLVRDLMTKAPGTYSHSITVGTLCEGAAKVIGLNPLFLRIAGLYHDIGKTLQPGYFVENQKEFNPHDELPPQESVRILKRHVSEGIALARRARLPSSLAELIPQHHGTKWMPFFFEKAKNGATGTDGEIQQAAFRYPGPKPQTKSAAILMLADSIEAAARTLSDHSQDRLLDLIRKLIADTIADEQFSECDITLSEIDRVTYSFLETLSSHYHGRIVYPPT